MAMKNIKIIFALFLSLIMAVSCAKENLEVSLGFSEKSLDMVVGEEFDLTSVLKVENSSKAPVFVSLNVKVASVSASGKVKALAAGEATVTASIGDKTARCVIKVEDVAAGSIALTCPETVVAGEESWATVTAQVSAEGFNMENLEWSFVPSDEALDMSYEKLSLSEYRVRAKAYVEDGVITVTVSDKKSSATKSVVITVTEPEKPKVPAQKISLSCPKSITEGEDVWGKITADVAPEDYDMENLVWEFTPTDESLGVVYEKMAANEYRVRFSAYKKGGQVVVKVTDSVSGKYMSARISVDERPAAGVTSIALSPESLVLYTDSEQSSLTVITDPEEYDRALLSWTSSADEVVTVEDGVLTVVGEGEAVVKVKDNISGLESQCEVKVVAANAEAEVKTIVLSPTNLSLRYSQGAVQLTAKCYDEDGNLVENYSALEWSADKMEGEIGKIDVVEVSQQGVVTVKNIGTTIITVWDKKNPAVKAICNVSVTGVLPTGITLSPSSLVLPVDMLFEGYQVNVLPEDCDNKGVSWTSSDQEVAVVDATGKVRTLKSGTTVIKVVTKEGNHAAECMLTVKDMAFAISLGVDSEYAGGIPQGGEAKVTASYTTVDGSVYTPSSTSWASSDTSLATIDEDGNVTISYGDMVSEEMTVTITHTADGEEATIDLKIIQALPESVEITKYPEDYKMYLGESFQFGAVVNPSTADQTVKWTCYSDATENAWRYIDLESGWFNANVVGTFSIGCRCAYEYRDDDNKLHMFDHIRATINIEVLPIDAESAALNSTELNLFVGNTASLNVTFNPSNTTYTQLEWTSSADGVAKVSSNGMVTALSPGEAVITARQEENDITLTCTVTVTERVKDYNIGDYYYSDGTISSEVIAGKTIVGVICSLNDVTGHDEKLKADHPYCNNGLVLSLKEVSDVKWQGYGASVSNWAEQNGFATLRGALVESASGTTDFRHYLTPEGEKMHGYNNTEAVKAYMNRDDYESLGEDYAVHLLEGWNETAPDATSGWYVPSVAELLAVSENAALVSTKMKAAGGSPFGSAGYWTSTENAMSGSNAVYVENIFTKDFRANELKSRTHSVRYVFAF